MLLVREDDCAELCEVPPRWLFLGVSTDDGVVGGANRSSARRAGYTATNREVPGVVDGSKAGRDSRPLSPR